MIVPAGGISLDGTRWVHCRANFLLPVCVLSCLFRRLFLTRLADAYRAGRLVFFGEIEGLRHRAAFDAHLIGIDPDYRIHVSDRLLEIYDGPFLELGLNGITGTLIDMPRRLADRRNRDRLALRFEQFKKAA